MKWSYWKLLLCLYAVTATACVATPLSSQPATFKPPKHIEIISVESVDLRKYPEMGIDWSRAGYGEAQLAFKVTFVADVGLVDLSRNSGVDFNASFYIDCNRDDDAISGRRASLYPWIYSHGVGFDREQELWKRSTDDRVYYAFLDARHFNGHTVFDDPDAITYDLLTTPVDVCFRLEGEDHSFVDQAFKSELRLIPARAFKDAVRRLNQITVR